MKEYERAVLRGKGLEPKATTFGHQREHVLEDELSPLEKTSSEDTQLSGKSKFQLKPGRVVSKKVKSVEDHCNFWQ